MDFLNKLGDTISAQGKIVADKAKETTEVLRLKSQISTCEEVIKKNYLEIGRLYYEQYGAAPEALFEKQCQAVANARTGIQELQEKIDEVRGI